MSRRQSRSHHPFAALIGLVHDRRHKRNAMLFTDQEHINTAAHRAWSGPGAADKNCALCTTAGAINLIQDRSLWTTGMIAELVGKGDNVSALGSSSVEQAAKIKEIVQAMSAARVKAEHGGPGVGQGIGLEAAMTWMAGHDPGTVFALLASGSIGHHWLNGIVTGVGSVTFIDYQTDKVRKGQWDLGKVTSDSTPFHGVSDQRFDEGATICSIAFSTG